MAPSVSYMAPLSQTFGRTLLFLGPAGCVGPHRARGRDGTLDRVKSGVLVHLCGSSDWEAAQPGGHLRPDSLHAAGFVHLSTPGQVHLPANRLFRGRTDLVLLHIDPDWLDAPLRWEPGVPTDPASMLFPHLYGPLPVAAVLGVTAYRPSPDGTFAPWRHGSGD